MNENAKTGTMNSFAEEFENILRRAENRMDSKDYVGAIHWYNKAIEMNPKDPWTYWERGLVKKAKNEVDSAICDFDKTIELQSDNAFAYFQRALLKEKKMDQSAEEDYKKAKELRASQPQRFAIEKKILPSSSVKNNFQKDGRSGNDFTQNTPETLLDDTTLTNLL
jgi:tetratricopeptide (TPR) repeat protein